MAAAAKVDPYDAMLAKLREPFPASDVKTRPGGGGKTLDYVAIETVLERLLDIAPDYSWEGRVVQIGEGNAVVVEGTLTIEGKRAYGVGAMKNPDLDMAVKSANSEAMKNAAKNGFGVALELWSEEHRQKLAKARKLTTPAAKKKALHALATERLGKEPKTLAEMAKVFGKTVADVQEVEGLDEILKAEGLL